MRRGPGPVSVTTSRPARAVAPAKCGRRVVVAAWRGRARHAVLAASLASASVGAAAAAAPEQLRVPSGFRIELVTDQVPGARQMALGRFDAQGRGLLYVGSRSTGRVYAVPLEAGRAVGPPKTIASGLQMPSGVAWKDGSLYIAAVSRILRIDGVDEAVRAGRAEAIQPQLVTDRLPTETHHGWKFIAFGPDGKLYVPIGAPCNVCEPDERHAVIVRMNADASGMETVARGVRNSVGFDWSPQDRALWFTDNGRDMLGDDVPNDELNRVATVGESFGFPYCHQGDVPDPEYGGKRRCGEFARPMALMGPHVAAIGMRFYTGTQFPPTHRGNAFIALHGSWNRSEKSGYAVVRVPVDAGGKAGKPEPFVEGFLRRDATGRETVIGRPADVQMLPDGSLLVSDDQGGAVYRIRYAPA